MELRRGLGFIVCIILGSQNVFGQNEAPYFTNDVNGFTIPENTETGAYLFKLTGGDPENDRLTFQIYESVFFEIREPETGEVYLKEPVDYESTQTVAATVVVSDGVSETSESITINVGDVNDEKPVFERESYQATVPEDTAVGTTVVEGLVVTDLDALNSLLQVRCVEDEPQEGGPCTMFSVSTVEQSENRWRGHIVLEKKLDYEQQDSYQMVLETNDGTNTYRQTVVITVQDVQDTPPVITSTLTTVLDEGVPIGTEVVKLEASDGDRDNPRTIRFSFETNPGNYFSINEETGSVTTARAISRDDSLLSKGFIELTVSAYEILPDGAGSGQYNPDTSVEATLTITISDVNDNGPVFEQNEYLVSMLEDIPNGSPLPGLSMKISDKDQGSNAEFQLTLSEHNDIFEVSPKNITKSASVSIRVKDSSSLDYDEGTRQYILDVTATELRTADRKFSTARVTVNLQDVNDNAPTFDQDAYSATVAETAPPGSSIITITAEDIDSGYNGPDALRYKLVGNGAGRFKCNRVTGEITVARCDTPGSGNCLDFEQQKEYTLTFVVGDKYGEGFIVNVPLTITVLDENDNRPGFSIPEYVSYIKEGNTIPDPTIQVKATDLDSSRNDNNRIRYSIVGGNQGNVWQIGTTSGVITATRPVEYKDAPGGQGFFILNVAAQDPDFTANTRAKIYIEDTNDHPPIFTQNGLYEQWILENTPPGTSVETVFAADEDPITTPNGQVLYRITTGAADKFNMDENDGEIVVAPGATFDYNVQKKYTMKVEAVDQGQPQFSATATVIVNIRDLNNKNPYFQPSTVRTSIFEDAPLQEKVVRMTAVDPDSTALLIYSIEYTTVQVFDLLDQTVDPRNYQTMFDIDGSTGDVIVSQKLDRDKVYLYQAIVKATDQVGGVEQTASATLYIEILDRNDQPPIFGPPWDPENPNIGLTIREEQIPGSFVTNLIASDPTDSITYEIINNPGGHFQIDPETGAITIQTPLDYEQQQYISFIAVAIDSGQPPLTSTATINVEIVNINDETPEFTETIYEVELRENSPGGTSVVIVQAADKDLGDYGIVRYELEDSTDRFQINQVTGLITVRPGALLDREETPIITITARAYDSPNDETVRRFASIPVYITLGDDNDNGPSFMQRDYFAVIIESAEPGSSVVKITANDFDDGENAKLFFFEQGGDPIDFFRVDPDTGLITTNQPLRGFPGIYNITVGVRNPNRPNIVDVARVTITVLEANNGPPYWIFPEFANYTYTVIEEQYSGMELIQVKANDDDKGNNGQITYGFYLEADGRKTFVQETPDFQINPYTGLISALKIFDREEQDVYLLRLVARDNGNPSMETEQFLTIKIGDINDYDPEFPNYRNCCTIPYNVSIYEGEEIGTLVGTVIAQDKDTGENAKIFYEITGGNDQDIFSMEVLTGRLFVNKTLNRDQKALHILSIHASNSNDAKTQAAATTCLSQCRDKSTVLLYIYVKDESTAPPEFSHERFNACIPVNSPVGKEVTKIVATDAETGKSTGITFMLGDLQNSNQMTRDDLVAPADTFIIGRTNGSVTTNRLLSRYLNHKFTATVEATDSDGLKANADLWIYSVTESFEIVLTVTGEVKTVKRDIESIKKAISEQTNFGVVCIHDIRASINRQENTVDPTRTDIIMYVIDGDTDLLIPPGILPDKLGPGTMKALAVASIGESFNFWDGFIIDPVVAAIIIILLLLLLGLLLLCCLCCCKTRLFGGAAYAYKEPLIINTGTINPLWNRKYYEDQELSMAVPGTDAQIEKSGAAFINAAYEADQTDLKMNMANGMVSHNDVRIETTLERSGMGNGAVPSIEAELMGGGGRAGMGTGLLLGLSSDEAIIKQMRSIGTMTPGGDNGGGHGGGDMHASGAYTLSASDVRRTGISPIGATLTRNSTLASPGYAQSSYSAHSSYIGGPRYHENNMGGGGGGHGRAIGIQTTNMMSTSVDDHDISFSPSQLGVQPWENDFPDGMYQGEIRLGTMRPPPGPAPSYQQVHETRFEERREEFHTSGGYGTLHADDLSQRVTLN